MSKRRRFLVAAGLLGAGPAIAAGYGAYGAFLAPNRAILVYLDSSTDPQGIARQTPGG